MFCQWPSIFLGSSEIPNSADPCLYVHQVHSLGVQIDVLCHSVRCFVKVKPGLHDAICLTDSFLFTQGHCVNF